MNGAGDDDAALAAKLMAAFGGEGVAPNLSYYTPILAGGVYTTPADYAAFLQGLIRTTNPLVMGSLLKPSASDPYAVCTNSFDPTCTTARYSPVQGLESFHYAFGHWIEDDPQDGDGSYSSAGAYGFYPWVDASKTYFGLVARSDTSHSSDDYKPGYSSWQCGRAIRAAFMSGKVSNPTMTMLASSFNPSIAGQATTLTTTVSGSVPSGTVNFSNDTTVVCPLVPLRSVGPSFQASCTMPLTANQTFTAKYGGDANNSPSTSTILTQTVVAATPFNPDQFGLTGAWYNPTTSGQGIVLEVYPDLGGAGVGQLFGGFFTYASTGQGTRVWYTLQGAVQRNVAAAEVGLYEPVAAGNFNAGPVIAAKAIGTATIGFGDCGHMTIVYKFTEGSGLSGTVPLTRLTRNTSCAAAADTGAGSDDRLLLSGAWYNPATSGQGLVFDISPSQNILSAAWYTYAPSTSTADTPTQQTWYTIQSNAFNAGMTSIRNVPIYTASGGAFNDPKPVVTSQVGTANIAFADDCRSMTLEYTFTSGDNAGQIGSIAMQSLALPTLSCTLTSLLPAQSN